MFLAHHVSNLGLISHKRLVFLVKGCDQHAVYEVFEEICFSVH